MTCGICYSVMEMLITLSWKNVLVLYDNQFDLGIFENINGNVTSYVTYDLALMTKDDIPELLDEIAPSYTSDVNILMFSNISTALDLIHQIEEHDYRTQTTDFKHYARLMVVSSEDKLSLRQFSTTSVENLAILTYSLSTGISNCSMKGRPSIRTLLFKPEGRVFSVLDNKNWRHIRQDELFPNVKYGYNGRTLIVMMQDRDYRKTNLVKFGNVSASGFAFQILDRLATALNFSYQVKFPENGVWGENVNGSWTGIVGMMQRKEADLVAETLSIISARMPVVDYILPPVLESGHWAVYKREDTDYNLMVFIRPFSGEVYFCLVGACVIYMILLVSMRWLYSGQKAVSDTLKRTTARNGVILEVYNSEHYHITLYTVIESVFETLGSIFRQGLRNIPSPNSERFLVVSWSSFIFILSSVYCSSILAALTVELNKRPFSDVAELAGRDDYRVGYPDKTALGTIIEESGNPDVVTIRKRVKELARFDRDVLSYDATTQMEKVRAGKYVYISDRQHISFMIQSNCNLDVIPLSIGTHYQAFATPKNSPYRREFSKIMFKLDVSGILARLTDELLQMKPKSSCPQKQYPRPVSLVKIRSILFLVAFGIPSAFCLFVLEILWNRLKSILL